MTTLISWVSVDSRGPAALYIASDSRISWAMPNGDVAGRWDIGRKAFACRSTPDVFGFAGDVGFASPLLGQLTELVDLGGVFAENAPPEVRAEAVRQLLEVGLNAYPSGQRRDFVVFYGTRSAEAMKSDFPLFVIGWQSTKGWSLQSIGRPATSQVLATEGSGRQVFSEAVDRWTSAQGRTSRAVFGAFCEGLASEIDPKSGGAPQLVRIHRQGPAKSIGVIWKDRRYLLGQEVPVPIPRVGEWTNELFEVCDPVTMKRQTGAQRQPRPY